MYNLNGQSVTVQGWMVESGLFERNELFIYAIIYAYSQGGQGLYYGRKSYLMKWTGYQKRQVRNILASLEKKELIQRGTMSKNGVDYVCYEIVHDKIKPFIDVDNVAKQEREKEKIKERLKDFEKFKQFNTRSEKDFYI
jgi:hypothetical protein